MHGTAQPEETGTLLYFGSFDPFTVGHTHVVNVGLSQVKPRHGLMIIPAWTAVWAKQLTRFADRRQMIEASIASNPFWKGKVSCSVVEEEQHFSGRTIETLDWLIAGKPP